ncbi:histidine phosphatase family protein [Alkalibacillus haloalkaliphilus]|uniref:histidine phosphatase family protein n=1 Tax=Alkalibacillus haloalkaliphilus TaxID=94136 RepID=UPI002935A895|nr:histidine phosphatase family protein [Alkalibacillus haloalkaliphilus]MDV2582372.1 histidine phosphatase family protein [Alkalibacillus haloalkaliphilus]
MELVFVRHGQAEHTINLPHSLHTSDPSLTNEGVNQAQLLKKQLPLANKDLIIISPIRRALQTAQIWSEGIGCHKVVSPLISPRMFPQKPDGQTLPCDELLSVEKIKEDFPDCHIQEPLSKGLWSTSINRLPDTEFNVVAEHFLRWCKTFGREKIYIVSHDGTITSYRQYVTGEELTRNDFPQEAAWVKVNY